MHPFPRGRVRRQPPRHAQRLGRGRQCRLVVEQHREIALEAMDKTELGIGLERTGEMVARVEPCLQVASNRAIEGRSRCGGGRGDRKTVCVLEHWRRGRDAANPGAGWLYLRIVIPLWLMVGA